MSILAHNFNKVAIKSTSRDVDDPNYPPPSSIRLTFEERARLDDGRGRKTLAVHIRNRLFGQDAGLCRKPGNSPIKDLEALGRVLGAFELHDVGGQIDNFLDRIVEASNAPVVHAYEARIDKPERQKIVRKRWGGRPRRH